MAKLTVAGIPIHPLINDLPAALLPVTAACDAIGMITGDRTWSRTAYHTLILSPVSGIVAGAAGAIDYTGVPARPAAKSSANMHALLNTGLIGAGFLNLMLRRGNPERPIFFSRLLSFVSIPLLMYSGLEGAILAYRYHMAETDHEVVAETVPTPTEVKPEAKTRKRAA